MISIGTVFYKENIKDISKFLYYLESSMLYAKKVEEIIFVLNESDQQLFEKLQNFLTKHQSLTAKKSKIILNSVNNVALARKKIVEESTAEWIYFIDPDIIIPESTIRNIQSCLPNTNKHHWAMSGVINQKSDYKILDQSFLFFSKLSGFFKFNFQGSFQMAGSLIDHAPTAHLVLKRSAVIKIGNFSEKFSLVGEDLDLSHRATQGGLSIYFADLPVQHNQNYSLITAIKKFFRYGQVQPEVFFENGFLIKRCYRLLPMVGAIICVGMSFITYKFIFLALVVLLVLALIQKGWAFAFCLTTIYGLGGIWGTLKKIIGLIRSNESTQRTKHSFH